MPDILNAGLARPPSHMSPHGIARRGGAIRFAYCALLIFFHKRVDILIRMELLFTRSVPPRGALEAFKCAGQPKAAPEMQRLAFGVLAGSTPAGPMRWPCSVLRGIG